MRVLLTAILLTLLTATMAQAQHACDIVYPVSGTFTPGQSVVLKHCHSGVDSNGVSVTGFKVYDNGVGTVVPMVKGSTPNGAGLYEFASPWTAPSGTGVHTVETTALAGLLESGRSNPFALTVSLPPATLSAPVKSRVQ